jgi:hypothetical protein
MNQHPELLPAILFRRIVLFPLVACHVGADAYTMVQFCGLFCVYYVVLRSTTAGRTSEAGKMQR